MTLYNAVLLGALLALLIIIALLKSEPPTA